MSTPGAAADEPRQRQATTVACSVNQDRLFSVDRTARHEATPGRAPAPYPLVKVDPGQENSADTRWGRFGDARNVRIASGHRDRRPSRLPSAAPAAWAAARATEQRNRA